MPRRAQMPDTIKTGTILIKEGTLCWTFSWRAGEIGATVFGLDEQKTLRRAVEQILANLQSAEFNSLEIMRVASEASKRFPGSALCDCLRPVTGYPGKRASVPGQGPSGEGPRTIGCRLNQSTGLARGNELRREEMITLIKVETILNHLRFRRRRSNKNDAECGHFPRYDPAFSSFSSRAGSFQVSELFAGNEFARTIKPG